MAFWFGEKNREEHDRKLQATLQKAQEIGLVFNKKKLNVAVQEVSYVGHIFTNMASNLIRKRLQPFATCLNQKTGLQ